LADHYPTIMRQTSDGHLGLIRGRGRTGGPRLFARWDRDTERSAPVALEPATVEVMSEISDRNLVLEGLVPEGQAAATLVTDGGERVRAVLTHGALYCRRVSGAEGQPHRGELRVYPIRSGQVRVKVSVAHRKEEDGPKVESAWWFDLGHGEPLAFTTEYTLGNSVRSPRPDPKQDDECFAHELAKALGCPLELAP
jgi:hypothetical protein